MNDACGVAVPLNGKKKVLPKISDKAEQQRLIQDVAAVRRCVGDRMRPFAERLSILSQRVDAAEENLNNAKRELRWFEMDVVPVVMNGCLVDRVEFDEYKTTPVGFNCRGAIHSVQTTLFGFTLRARSDLKVHIAERNKFDAFAWLRRNGHGKKIKEVTTTTIHAGSLKKIIREAIENEAITDDEQCLFGVFNREIAEVKTRNH